MGLFRSMFNWFKIASSHKDRQILRCGLKFEHLENRSLLSAVPVTWSLSSVEGVIDPSTSPSVILNLNTQPDEEVILGIDISAHKTSTLNPGHISILRYDTETGIEKDVTEEVTYLNLEDKFDRESLVYAKLSSGEYHLTFIPQNGTEGDFTASVFLVGDHDGSGIVEHIDYELLAARISAIQIHNRGVYSQPTIKLYQNKYGIDITRSANQIYSSTYDFNLDGTLDGEDIKLVNSNFGTSVIAKLKIRTSPIPEITPVPYTVPDILDSNDYTSVELNIPNTITVRCESSTVDSFTVLDQSSITPSLSLTASDGTIYSTREDLIAHWGITENDYDDFLNSLAEQTSLTDGIWTFKNVDGLFDILGKGDLLTTTYSYTVNSFVYEGESYNTSKSGTISLKIIGKEEHSDPVGPSSHTASFDVGTGQIIFNGSSPSLNVLDGVVDPLGYDMTASLISVTSTDPLYPVSSDAISISSNGTVELVPEILAEDFENLKRGKNSTVVIAYSISDTHSGRLDGSITLTVTGGNHAPTGKTSHTAKFSVSTGAVIFNDLYTSLNVLDAVTDPDGDPLVAEMAGIVQPAKYTVSLDAISIDEKGEVKFNVSQLQSDFSGLSVGETAFFTINFIISDPYGGSIDGELVVEVDEGSKGPQGVTDHTATIDLRNKTVTYDEGKTSLNLLDGVTDSQSLELSVTITDIDAGTYTLPVGAVTQTDGLVSIKVDDFQETFKNLAQDQTSEVIVTFVVSNTAGNDVAGELTVTVIGNYVAPYETEALTGTFDVETGVAEFSSGEASPDILYGIANPAANNITGQIISILPPDGYTLSEESILLVNSEGDVQRLIVNSEHLANDFDLLPLGETAEITIDILLTDSCGSTLSRSVVITVTGAYVPIPEGDVTISLVATVLPTTEGVTTLRTGTTNFGTFYYLPADNVPVTDYQSVALADEYYLEVWVNDANYFSTGEKKFISSIQLQIEYDLNSTSPVQSIEIEDIYAGKYAIDQYLYYDSAENYLKALQVAWVFSEDLDWNKIDPITNGENAYLLARFLVTLDRPYTSGFNTSITGVTDSESPFVDGWYYVRTGENYPIDSSEIITVNVEF
ncbi:MAG: hypothetical protein IKE69_12960 [Thermoguttaceae bacterium]|nr:hypothetical protein [Thermoguttaceae bacterium]